MKFPSSEFDDAVDALCDGTVSESTVAELNKLLRSDTDALDEYLWRLEIHGALISSSLDLGHMAPPSEEPPTATVASRPTPVRMSMRGLFVAIAAAILLAFMGGFWYWSDRTRTLIAASDPFLAIVIAQSPDAEWSGRATHRGVGHAIGRDREYLKKGEATLLLDNAVELKLRGPTEFTFLSVDHGLLHRGQVSARVPESAIGFRLDAPGLNVVDLGTEFSVATDVSGAPAVHVFTGKVRAALPTLPASRTELTTGETARFDISRGVVSRRSDESLEYFPRLDGDGGLPTVTGNAACLREAPKSVLNGTYEHDSILIFREQANISLPKKVRVLWHATNQRTSPEPSVPEFKTLDAGTRVQSFLVHFDRVGSSWNNGIQVKGSIRFKQPILGLIAEIKNLERTDPFLCHSGTAYDKGGTRPLELRCFNGITEGNDEFEISDDGHEIHMTLHGGPYVDQFRILVAVE